MTCVEIYSTCINVFRTVLTKNSRRQYYRWPFSIMEIKAEGGCLKIIVPEVIVILINSLWLCLYNQLTIDHVPT